MSGAHIEEEAPIWLFFRLPGGTLQPICCTILYRDW